MNIFISGIIIFVLILLVLRLLGSMSTKRLSKIVRSIIVIFSLLVGVLLAFGGRFLFSLPLILIGLGIIKLKGLTIFQIFQLWRLLSILRNSGRFSQQNFGNNQINSNMSIDEAYKILNLKKGVSKSEVNKAAQKIQKKIHPDVSPETARLSALVNEARDVIVKDIS
tara:strand:+ start:133 stop:633 length:501 start_codon:yes stop_codon:yes gene_type:complete